MRNTILLIAAFAFVLAALCSEKPKETSVTKKDIVTSATSITANSSYIIGNATLTYPTVISLSVKGGYIKIDLQTGAVDIPSTVSLDDASKAFWRALAQAYPSVRHELLECCPPTHYWGEWSNTTKYDYNELGHYAPYQHRRCRRCGATDYKQLK